MIKREFGTPKVPLTKEDRLDHYEAALEEFENGVHYLRAGFCRHLPYDLTKENYPELWKFKPFWVEVYGGGGFKNKVLGGIGYWFKPRNHWIRKLILRWIIMRMT